MELLCIQTHSAGAVKAGNTYTAIDFKQCACGITSYNIGLKEAGQMICTPCGRIFETNGIWWISERLFAPMATEDEVNKKELIITHS